MMAELDVEKLDDFIDRYILFIKNDYGHLKKDYNDREKVRKFFNNITPEQISEFSKDDMENFFMRYWSTLGFTPSQILKNNELPVLKDFITRIYTMKSINEELWNCKIRNIGAPTKSEMVSKINNNEFILVNSRTSIVLNRLGFHIPKFLSNLSWKKYSEIIEICLAIGREMEKRGMNEHSLYDVDGLIYFISMELEKEVHLPPKEQDIETVDDAWFVDAYYSSKDGDMNHDFIAEGKWINSSTNESTLNAVRKVKEGDHIVMKSTCVVKKVDLFNSYGKSVSMMDIHAKGIVKKNYGDGRTLDVDWELIPEGNNKWYFFTYIKTIWHVQRKEYEDMWMYGDLLDFVFNGKPQNIDAFLEHEYWNEKYGVPKETMNEKIEKTYENKTCDDYSEEEFINEVFMTMEQYKRICNILKLKKNLILQGAPGVGKTFCAKRLAYSILGGKDETRVKCIQFHQNYSYEEFIMGYRPEEDGSFKLREGVFFNFCEKARSDLDNDFFFIIDEINRGNLSKIFGEIMMLIEADKRGTDSLDLAYRSKGESIEFSIPDNVYIIGMMNTADRSLAMIDYALRRRFAFIDIEPAFNNQSFRKLLVSRSDESTADKIISKFKSLNEEISKDGQLGRGFCIGHSYLCNVKYDDDGKIIKEVGTEWYDDVLDFEIRPLLEEYWYDEPVKVEDAMTSLKIE